MRKIDGHDKHWMNNRILNLFFPVFLLIPVLLSGQQQSLPEKYFKGYEKSIKGGGFLYHSPQPDVTSSLLVRSIDSVQYIEWGTEVIPASHSEKMVNLIWMFGIDANIESHSFKVYLNDRYCLTFHNPLTSDIKSWTVNGVNDCRLFFRPVMIDKYGDPMGYAIFTVPVAMIIKDKSQRIRIVGESKESRSWYMTFENGVEEKLTIKQVPALIRGKDENHLQLLFQFVHLGSKVDGFLEIPGIPKERFALETGFNEIKVLLPETTPPGEKTAIVTVSGTNPMSANFTILPFCHFTIYLVQHTHTDIGYTRPQTEILPDHLRYIDYALDFCDQTDSLPDEARFRWTCETSWAVREYLKTRPASQIERLKRRVREGRIELAALFLNSSDLSDETSIAASLQPIKFFREMGLPVKSAMQSDINGVPWCLTDFLPDAGIEYLNMAQNTHRALKPFNRPATFWWESPSGKRLMVNRPEHYMWANNIGILSQPQTFATGLFRHLEDIGNKGYPYDHYAIQFSGYLTDNSPPSSTACKLVEEWNKTYVWPKLKLATLSEFMDYMKTEHSGELPVVRGAWPDWWMDGFGSAAIQTAYSRTAHADNIANLGLMSMASIMGVKPNGHITDLQKQITDDILFYDEHTFGAAESITDPLCENSVVQLAEKESYIWSAVKKNRILREEVMGALQPLLPRADIPTLTVFNTLDQMRTGNIMVYIDHQLLPKDRKFSVLDVNEEYMKMQMVSTREEGTWWMLNAIDVPAMGFRTYRIKVGQEPSGIPTETPFRGILENAYYRVSINPVNQSIISIFDKTWNLELVDENATYTAGEVIYERLGKNRGQLEQLRLEEFTRTGWKNLHATGITDGPVWKSVTISGELPECAEGAIRCEIRIYHHVKKLEFCYSMKKLPVTDPEGVYVAFPFILKNGELVAQVAGGTMIPGKQQVEGSSSDWLGIQDFVALRSDSGQIVMVSPEIPLVQLGDLNLGKFFRVGNPNSDPSPKKDGQGIYPASGHIYSWVLNNYWTTNFLASQKGELKWNYQVTSGNDPSNTAASRFGAENRVPMLSRVFPAVKGSKDDLMPRSFYWSGSNGVALVSSRTSDDGKGILMHFRETAGRSDSIPIDDLRLSCITLRNGTDAISATEVNVLEQPVKKIWETDNPVNLNYQGSYFSFKPFESRFLLLGLKEK